MSRTPPPRPLSAPLCPRRPCPPDPERPAERLAVALLLTLPATPDDARRRAPGQPLSALREALVDLIEREGLSQAEGDRLSPLFKVLGVEEVGGRLERLARSGATDVVRDYALAALFHSEPGLRLFESLTPEERVARCGPWVRPMVSMARDDAFPRVALVALYRATPAAARPLLTWKIESCRQEVGGDPRAAYEQLLRAPLTAAEAAPLLQGLREAGALSAVAPLMEGASAEARAEFARLLASDEQVS